jgi:hypothetical protein
MNIIRTYTNQSYSAKKKELVDLLNHPFLELDQLPCKLGEVLLEINPH